MLLEKIGLEKSEIAFHGDIPGLTSSRFLASVYIILFHVLVFSGKDAGGWMNNFFASGYLAVDFFFILSGFILAHNYLPAIQNKTFLYKKFIIKRIARIYPVHITTLIIVFIIIYAYNSLEIGTFSNGHSWKNFASNVLLTQAWFGEDDYSFNRPSWSISAEFFAYVFFPLMALTKIYMSPLKGIASAIVFFLAMNIFLNIAHDQKITELTTNYGILRIIPEFYYGIVICVFFKYYTFIKT